MMSLDADTGHTPQTPPAENPAPNRRRRRLQIAAAVAAVVIVLSALAIVPGIATLQPGYYERYPDARQSVAHWRDSTHSRMSCAGCHLEPGFEATVEYGLKAIPIFYSQLLSGQAKTGLLRQPSSSACLKCHTVNRQVSADGDLLMPHGTHVDKLKIDCAECHSNLVHTKNPRSMNRPSMTSCTKVCHNGKRATDQCIKCHTGKQVPATHKRSDWLRTHQTESKKAECKSCHAWTPNFCDTCHARRPANHQVNWRKLHGARIKAQGESVCMFCHERRFCKKCH